ncbi:hypothetical protein [Nocardioides zeae]
MSTTTLAFPLPLFPRLDHTACEGDCGRVICACTKGLCTKYFEDACDHGRRLCEDCRPVCGGCRDEARDDSANGGGHVAWIAVPFEETVPADGDMVLCRACDRGAVLADADEPDPGARYDACSVCEGVGAVPYAAVLGGVA